MKRLNKKGFTLVELLAVVVILAILIAVVATTAIPAMTNAKQKAADTFASRLNAKAKEACMVEKLGDGTCTYPATTSTEDKGMEALMGASSTQYKISTAIVVEITNGVAEVTAGEIEDRNTSSIKGDVKDK